MQMLSFKQLTLLDIRRFFAVGSQRKDHLSFVDPLALVKR
jgi:hypothetical protein